MPAYENHLNAGDVSALWAYVAWLRSEAPRDEAMPMEEHEHE